NRLNVVAEFLGPHERVASESVHDMHVGRIGTEVPQPTSSVTDELFKSNQEHATLRTRFAKKRRAIRHTRGEIARECALACFLSCRQQCRARCPRQAWNNRARCSQ